MRSNRDYRIGNRTWIHPAVFSLDIAIACVCVVVYAVNRFWLKSVTDSRFVHNYLNDLLAMGVLLPYCNSLIRICNRPDLLLMTWQRVLPFAILGGIFWEYVTPMYLSRSVSDPIDLICYSAGAMGYYGLHRLASGTP